MSKKSKKLKQIQKEAQRELQSLNSDQIIQKAKEFLNSDKPRFAIDILKTGLKKDPKSQEIQALLFQAYILREKQLRDKKMYVEAEVIKKQAMNFLPPIQQITETDLVSYLKICPLSEAIKLYAQFISTQKTSQRIDQLIANRMVIENQWDTNALPPNLPICKDIPTMQQAVPLMNDGKWEEALDVMQTIPRQSLYAPFRLFCRAMVLFYREDDQNMLRTLAGISDDFPLIKVVNSLRSEVESNTGKCKPNRIPCLWKGVFDVKDCIQEMIDGIDKENLNKLVFSIKKLANMIYPQDPVFAAFSIVEIVCHLLKDKWYSTDMLTNVLETLPYPIKDVLSAKLRFIYPSNSYIDTARYISFLEYEFPDPELRRIAHSKALIFLADSIKQGVPIISIRDLEQYRHVLGIKSVSFNMHQIEIVSESIRLNPSDRKGYELLVSLYRPSKEAQKKVEQVLLSMMDIFPEDPYPCLELASLYYESNAFRKAETILETAMRRAPYDQRVIDKHAASLLISAEKNIKREKYHLVYKDIERAKSLDTQKIKPFILEKWMLLLLLIQNPQHSNLINTNNQLQVFSIKKDLKTILAETIDNLPLCEQIRIIILLLSDLQKLKQNESDQKQLNQILKDKFKNIHQATSEDIARLLAPIERNLQPIYPYRNLVPRILTYKNDILSLVSDLDILLLIDIIYLPEIAQTIKQDIKRRLNSASQKNKLLFEFYITAIDHITGQVSDFDQFINIIQKADKPTIEEMRKASRNFSCYATGLLKNMMLEFNFDKTLFIDDDMNDEYDDDMDDDDYEDEVDKEAKELLAKLLISEVNKDNYSSKKILQQLINKIEEDIDRFQLRGASLLDIQNRRNLLQKSEHYDIIAAVLEEKGEKKQLSREAYIFLYGKNKYNY